MSASQVSVSAVVRGRVQGVAFRASLAARARELGLAGWVRNAPDGSVHFAAGGVTDDVDLLLAWARRGPPLARLDALETQVGSPGSPSEAGLPTPFAVLGDLPR